MDARVIEENARWTASGKRVLSSPASSLFRSESPQPSSYRLHHGLGTPVSGPLTMSCDMDSSGESIDLVRRAQNGDSEALNYLFERYYDRIRRIIRVRLSSRLRRKYDSLDLVQETFYIAIRRFDRFELRHEASLINWLAKIAQNLILSKGRRGDVRYEQALRDLRSRLESGEIVIPDPEDLPSTIIRKNEEKMILEECLAELPEHYREVILIRHFATPPGAKRAVPWEVVAREIGEPTPDAARMLHSRARTALSRLLRQRIPVLGDQ